MASQDTPESAKHLPLKAASISRSSPAEQIAVLDILFEPSQSLHELGLPLLQTPFNSYRELIDCVRAELRQLAERAASNDTDRKILYDILGSHPRLGAPKNSHLSEFSRREQANLATAAAAATSPGQGAEDEADRLRKLNEEYERTFPGLRYVWACLISIMRFHLSHICMDVSVNFNFVAAGCLSVDGGGMLSWKICVVASMLPMSLLKLILPSQWVCSSAPDPLIFNLLPIVEQSNITFTTVLGYVWYCQW